MTNLQVLRPSRVKPAAGDLFAMQVRDGRYLFGRVVSTQAEIGPMKDVILIYVYRPTFSSKEPPDRSALSSGDLLVPPVMTNRLPWSKGYFETVTRWPLEAGEILRHCFRRSNGQYFDEANHELPGPVEPVGDWGLHSYQTIDDLVSDALGLDRAPD